MVHHIATQLLGTLGWFPLNLREFQFVTNSFLLSCSVYQCVAVYCSVLQYAAVCCSVPVNQLNQRELQCDCNTLKPNQREFWLIPSQTSQWEGVSVCYSVLKYAAVRCSMLQCAAVYCSVVQCGAVWCRVLWLSFAEFINDTHYRLAVWSSVLWASFAEFTLQHIHTASL